MASNETNKAHLSNRAVKLHKPVHSLDHGANSQTPKSAGTKSQTSVFARIQAHFLPHGTSPPPPRSGVPKDAPRPEPPFIKVRIITWNMNESLPKGDLSPLLGRLPPYEEASSEVVNLRIPGLSLDPDHPCHIVAIAGQECPTLMGLPLGLGGGMKWERHEEDEKRKERKEKETDKGKDKPLKGSENGGEDPSSGSNGAKTPITSGARTPRYQHSSHHASGWSAILEDYFSRGIGTVRGAKPNIKSPPRDQSRSSFTTDRPQLASATDNKDVKWDVPNGGGEVPNIGPYELLTKERLMGIYLALYVHRDVRPLVEGCSQSSVAAGLMRGRLGNKGAVAISLKLSGVTFLFLSAHLAAHEGRVAHRLANMTKIKAELEVDDFLDPNDARKNLEDPTDRFDHTFLCGDLNFRLDITRLHAEWLISRREYAQAQEFDQLRKIMNGLGTSVFSGFHEATIDFPPTFKYDILRTLKGSKRRRERRRRRMRQMLSGVEETKQERSEQCAATNPNGSPFEGDNDHGADSDSSSSSSRSRTVSATSSDSTEQMEKGGEDKYDERDSRIGRKASHATKSVKKRWRGIFHSKSAAAGTTASVKHAEGRKEASSTSKISATSSQPQTPISTKSNPILTLASSMRSTVSMDIPRRSEAESRPSSQLARSTASSAAASEVTFKANDDDEAALGIEDKGVYDTSSKQRVPSWCDRILFKSTVPVSSSPVELIPPISLPSGTSLPPVPESVPLPSSRNGFSKMGTLLQALTPRSRSGSSPVSFIKHSALTGSTEVVVPDGRTRTRSSTQINGPGVPLRVITDVGREEESPIEISTSADLSCPTTGLPTSQKQDGAEKGRALTVPDMAEVEPGASDRLPSLRPHGKRRRSLSATLPRTREPVEPPNRGLPASASTPPVEPLLGDKEPRPKPEYSENGRGLGLKRILSLLPAALIHSHPPPPDTAQTLAIQGPSLRIYKRGEVRCLGYNTLSDREMRQLEGRSDHRPVVGHYAVYV